MLLVLSERWRWSDLAAGSLSKRVTRSEIWLVRRHVHIGLIAPRLSLTLPRLAILLLLAPGGRIPGRLNW